MMLTEEECYAEINKVKDYFEQVPSELKIKIALHFIVEIARVTCGCLFHGLGLFTEATFLWREMYLEDCDEEGDD